jgi:hypothetical protein
LVHFSAHFFSQCHQLKSEVNNKQCNWSQARKQEYNENFTKFILLIQYIDKIYSAHGVTVKDTGAVEFFAGNNLTLGLKRHLTNAEQRNLWASGGVIKE